MKKRVREKKTLLAYESMSKEAAASISNATRSARCVPKESVPLNEREAGRLRKKSWSGRTKRWKKLLTSGTTAIREKPEDKPSTQGSSEKKKGIAKGRSLAELFPTKWGGGIPKKETKAQRKKTPAISPPITAKEGTGLAKLGGKRQRKKNSPLSTNSKKREGLSTSHFSDRARVSRERLGGRFGDIRREEHGRAIKGKPSIFRTGAARAISGKTTAIMGRRVGCREAQPTTQACGVERKKGKRRKKSRAS